MVILIGVVAIALMLAGVFGWYALNGQSGERYLRRQAQGPFVPLTRKPADDVLDPSR